MLLEAIFSFLIATLSKIAIPLNKNLRHRVNNNSPLTSKQRQLFFKRQVR